MEELKPCKNCFELPELKKGIELGTGHGRYRFYCIKCDFYSKSSSNLFGAIEEWNRSVQNENS